MAYTVKKLAIMSGVSVRTLHFYDEIGLLKPAYHGANGYRFYEEAQLLLLQQILFYRELGFELKQIQKLLGRKDFDKIAALSSHRLALQKNLNKTAQLIKTIDKTVDHIKGTKKMKHQMMYTGFNKEKHYEYQTYLKNLIGGDHPSFEECNKNIESWTKAEWEKIQKAGDEINKELANCLKGGASPSSPEVQKVVRKHYAWMKQFWTPDRASYTALGQIYTGFEWKKAFAPYDSNHPRLAKYLAAAMKIFAERELS